MIQLMQLFTINEFDSYDVCMHFHLLNAEFIDAYSLKLKIYNVILCMSLSDLLICITFILGCGSYIQSDFIDMKMLNPLLWGPLHTLTSNDVTPWSQLHALNLNFTN